MKFKKVWPSTPLCENRLLLIIGIILCGNLVGEVQSQGSFGTLIGKMELPPRAHDVSGTVYAVDNDHIFITNFNYDGQAPAAFFWVGVTAEPTEAGTPVDFPEGSKESLTNNGFKGVSIFLTLPAGRKVKDIKYVTVWCRNAVTSFGHAAVPANLKLPQPVPIDPFVPSASVPGLTQTGNPNLVNTRVARIPAFTFDGVANPGTFILAGNASTMDEKTGTKVAMMEMEGQEIQPLIKYEKKEIMVGLHGERTFLNTRWLIVYQIANKTNFGTLTIPPADNLTGLTIPVDDLKKIARAAPTVTPGILTCLSILITAFSAFSFSDGIVLF